MADEVTVTGNVPPEVIVLLHDAQTSGGLLLSVSPAVTGRLLDDLATRGMTPALIGEVIPGAPGRIAVHAAAAAAAR
jgi:selenophosphate synthase